MPLAVNEFGATVTVTPLWTGTVGGGITANETCSGHTSAANYHVGVVGTSGTNGASWSINGSQTCDQLASLVCLEAQHARAPPIGNLPTSQGVLT